MKCEFRQKKLGGCDISKCLSTTPYAEAVGGTHELIELVDESSDRLVTQDTCRDRLLKVARRIVWLSYQADPPTGHLVRSDTFERARDDCFKESSHRRPHSWCEDRYQWIIEDSVPNGRMSEVWSNIGRSIP